MNLEKTMSTIVRGTGVLCALVAICRLLGLFGIVWERRGALGSLGGYGEGLLPVVLLGGCGAAFWIYGVQIGRWLCREPVKRRARPAAQKPLETGDKTEEQSP